MTHNPDPRARAQAAWDDWSHKRFDPAGFLLAFVESERKIAAEAGDHAELRRVVEAATPGPWTREKPKSNGDGFACGVGIAATAGRQMIYANPPGGSYPSNDANFIAAFNPATALALIDSLAAKDAEIAELRAAIERANQELIIRAARYSQANDKIVKQADEIATLRARVEDMASTLRSVWVINDTNEGVCVVSTDENGVPFRFKVNGVVAPYWLAWEARRRAALAKGKTGEEG